MRGLLLVAVHLFVTVAKLPRPGGVCSLIAESLLLKHQLRVSGRSRRRAPPLTTLDRKYRRLFSSTGSRRKPGRKCSPEEIVAAILEMKLRNPRFGNQRIAEQISLAFAVHIDKDVVRRVLAQRYGSNLPGAAGLSWLTFFAQTTDSLRSVDLFRCESILLRGVPHVQSAHCRPCTARSDQYGS